MVFLTEVLKEKRLHAFNDLVYGREPIILLRKLHRKIGRIHSLVLRPIVDDQIVSIRELGCDS